MGTHATSRRLRSMLLRGLIAISRAAQGHRVFEGSDLDREEQVWEYAIGDVPTAHLEECFKRALRAKRDNYPLSAVEVNSQWAEYKQEINRISVASELTLLQEAARSSGHKLLTFSEWKSMHTDSENPRHDSNTCAFCLGRARRGESPVQSMTGYSSWTGNMDKYEVETEARAMLDRYRAERKAEGFRPLQDVPPNDALFDDESDLDDLAF